MKYKIEIVYVQELENILCCNTLGGWNEFLIASLSTILSLYNSFLLSVSRNES